VPLRGTGVPASTGTTDGSVLYRVNAGGAWTDGSPAWLADGADAPSPLLTTAWATAATATDDTVTLDASVPAGTPAVLFRSGRTGITTKAPMLWSFPVPAGGQYTVKLFFAETDPRADRPGARQFDVVVEDHVVLDHYDIAAEVGPDV